MVQTPVSASIYALRLACTFLTTFFLAVGPTKAAPHLGDAFFLKQPDGSRVEVRVWGDEFHQFVESPDGYTLVRDPASGWIHYADLSADGESLVVSGEPYTQLRHSPAVRSLATRRKKHLRIKRSARRRARALTRHVLRGGAPVSSLPGDGISTSTEGPPINERTVVGEVTGLTLLIEFPDVAHTLTRDEISHYLNQKGYNGFGNNGSVRDYFGAVSDDKLNYVNDVAAYYTAANPKSYYTDPTVPYGTRARELIHEALNHLESNGYDFSALSTRGNRIMAINALYAGDPDSGWSEGLWPHKWNLWPPFVADGVESGNYQITSMGNALTLRTFVHENGHMLMGWPDLYDYDYDSYGAGNYCIMAFGASNTNPVPPNPYFRELAGWETVTYMTDWPAGSVLDHQANTSTSYRYANVGSPGEMFYIENRRQRGRSASLPDEGLLIWHVDEFGSNNDQEMTSSSHYRVSVEQADNAFDLENDVNAGGAGDLFHAGDSSSAFNDHTEPSASWWDGGDSNLHIHSISSVGDTMRFMLGNAPAANNPNYPTLADDGTVTLIPDNRSNASAVVWYQEMDPPYSVTFEYSIYDDDGGPAWNSADGIVVMLLKKARGYPTPPIGQNRGFVADGTGFGVHFKTYGTSEILLVDGAGNTLARSPSQVYTHGKWFTARVEVLEKQIRVHNQGKLVIDWTSHELLAKKHKHVGFGAATGQADGEHKIRNVEISGCSTTAGGSSLFVLGVVVPFLRRKRYGLGTARHCA